MARKKAKPQHRPAHTPPALSLVPDAETALAAGLQALPVELMSMLTEQVVRDMIGPPLTPEAARAQELHLQAIQATNPNQQRKLARQALAACPDFVDAALLLADLEPARKERLRLLEQAVAAGERGFDRSYFTDPAKRGHFWGLLETHPYLRARRELGDFLWRLGRRDDAIRHYQEMLQLDGADVLGVRYHLAPGLLELDRRSELEELLQRYPREQAAGWKFLRAMLAFRQEGDTPHSRKLLKAADKASPEILEFLFDPAQFYDALENPQTPAEEETVGFVQASQGAVRNTPGALDWAARVVSKEKRRKVKEPAAVGPRPKVLKALAALPQRQEAEWEAELRRMPTWLDAGHGMVRPWMMLVASPATGQVLGQGMFTSPPTADQVWDVLAMTMRRPMIGKPHRPRMLRLTAGPQSSTTGARVALEAMLLHLEQIGVPGQAVDQLAYTDHLFADLFRNLEDMDDRPGLPSIPGIRPELLQRFYAAAAEFFRQAPWAMLDADYAIKVECRQLMNGPCFGMLMGQMGMANGLALYDNLKMLQATTRPGMSPEENARQTRALSLLYGEAPHAPCQDVEAIEAHGWAVAGPAAYPWLFRKEKGLRMDLPSKKDIDLMTACLSAIPAFVAAHNLDDEARETTDVALTETTVTVTLSWQHLG